MKKDRPFESEESLLADLQWLRHLAARLIQDPALADDACQEAWLLAGGNTELPNRRPALFRAMRRFAWRWHRSENRRKAREEQSARPVDLPSTAELLARGEERQILWRRLTELDEPYRTALLWKFQEGLDTKAIAERRGAPEDTVRRWVRRGLQLLRERYENDRSASGLDSLAIAALPLGASSTSAALSTAASSAKVWSTTSSAGTSMSAATSSAAAILGAWVMKKTVIGIVLVLVALVIGNTLTRKPVFRKPVLSEHRQDLEVELAAPTTSFGEKLSAETEMEKRAPVDSPVSIEAAVKPESAAETCRVHGRIVDTSDAPIDGARVRLVCGETHWTSVPVWEREVLTDIDGQFVVESEGYQEKYPIRLFATATPFHSEVELQFGSTDKCQFGSLRVPSVDAGTLRLNPAGVFEGRLVDGEGEPIEGAWIDTNRGRNYTRSDRDGRFRMEHRVLGSQRLEVQCAGYLEYEPEIELKRNEALQLGDITLKTAERISGFVTDPSGKAIAGATVSTGGYTRGWVFDVEPDGTFDVPLRDLGSGTIYSRAPGYRQTDGQDVVAGETEIHIILAPQKPFYTLDVFDAESGEKLTHFGITLREGTLPEGDVLAEEDWSWSSPKSSDQGYGRVFLRSKPGYGLVDVVAPGYERKIQPLTVEPGLTFRPEADQIQIVSIEPSGGVCGRLMGEHGPLAGVDVSLHFGMLGKVKAIDPEAIEVVDIESSLVKQLDAQGMYTMHSMVPLDLPLPTVVHSSFAGHDVYKTYTNADGRFRFNGVSDGVGRLSVRTENNYVIDGVLHVVGEDGNLDLGDIALVKAATVRGRLVADSPCDLSGCVVSVRSDENRKYRVDEDGVFEFPGTFPGDHWLRVEPGPSMCSPNLASRSFYYRLEAGEERELEVPIPAVPACHLSASFLVNGTVQKGVPLDFYLASENERVGSIHFDLEGSKKNGQLGPGRRMLPAGELLRARISVDGATLESPEVFTLPIGRVERSFEFTTTSLEIDLPPELELGSEGQIYLRWRTKEGASGVDLRLWLDEAESFLGSKENGDRRLLFPHVPVQAASFELLLESDGPYSEEGPEVVRQFEAKLEQGSRVRVSM